MGTQNAFSTLGRLDPRKERPNIVQILDREREDESEVTVKR